MPPSHSPPPPPPPPSASALAASMNSDSSELMWEEQLRVAAVAVAELHQLVTQRRRAQSTASAAAAAAASAARPADTGTLAYSSLSPAQADGITAHLLLTSHTLLHQLVQQWTWRHGGSIMSEESEVQCHDPSPLPHPSNHVCPCRTRNNSTHTNTRSTPHSSPTMRPSAAATTIKSDAATIVDHPPSSPESGSAVPASAIRRTVLPFSNISLLEKNILGPRSSAVAKGGQLRSHQQHLQHFANGQELVSARDIQLLQTHFTHLLTQQMTAATAALPTVDGIRKQTPLALAHPFEIMLHEFLVHWKHQITDIQQVNSQAARFNVTAAINSSTHSFGALAISTAASSSSAPSLIVIDRAFFQSQLTALFTFLSSHETLIVLSYPHLSHTSLCRKVLRTALRATVLNHPDVFDTLLGWSEKVHEEQEQQLTIKIDTMKHLSLKDIGLTFPLTLNAESLLQQQQQRPQQSPDSNGLNRDRMRVRVTSDESIEPDTDDDEMAFRRARLRSDAARGRVDERYRDGSSSSAAADRLIHSDEDVDADGGESERGIMQEMSPPPQARSRVASMSTTPLAFPSFSLSSPPRAISAGQTNNSGGIVTLQQHSFPSSGQRYNAAAFLNMTPPLAATPAALSSHVYDLSAAVVPDPSSPSSPHLPSAIVRSSSIDLSDSSEDSAPTLHLPPAYSHHSHSPSPSSSPSPPLMPFQPYAQSISLLSTLDAAVGVDAKLEVIVAVCRMISSELTEFLQLHGLQEPASANNGGSGVFSLCCDDLFQIFSYCLIHAQLIAPVGVMNLLSECLEGPSLNGEIGYCLTTMQCAVQLILAWTPEAAKEVSDQENMRAEALAHAALQMPSYAAGPPTPSFGLSVQDQQTPQFSVAKMHLTPSNASSSIGSGSQLNSPVRGSAGRESIGGGFASPSPLPSAVSTPATPSSSASAASSMYGPLLATNLDAFCVAADYLEPDGGWQWLYGKDGVTVYRKLYPGSPIHSIKGVSIIPRPPHLVQSFLKSIQNRQHIDELFIGGRVVQQLSPNECIVQYKFKARNWCSRQQTDMVMMHHQSLCSDGASLLTLAFSVVHPLCPPAAPFSRSSVRASGWLLKPFNGGRDTHCTYIVSPDPNGFPAWVVNLVCTKQPLIIRELTEYLLTTTTADQVSATNSNVHSRRQSTTVAAAAIAANAATSAVSSQPTTPARKMSAQATAAGYGKA